MGSTSAAQANAVVTDAAVEAKTSERRLLDSDAELFLFNFRRGEFDPRRWFDCKGKAFWLARLQEIEVTDREPGNLTVAVLAMCHGGPFVECIAPSLDDLPFEKALEFTGEFIREGESKRPVVSDSAAFTEVRRITSDAWPTARVLKRLAEFAAEDTIVSVGCGNAYWESLLQRLGKRVIATDNWQEPLTYCRVQVMEAEAAVKMHSSANCLFIGYPTGFGYDAAALAAFPGSKLIVTCDGAMDERSFESAENQALKGFARVGSHELWSLIKGSWKRRVKLRLPCDLREARRSHQVRCYVRRSKPVVDVVDKAQ